VAEELARQGHVIISGLALGIDTLALQSAVCHHPTIAVLGSGILKPYPYQNQNLAQRIVEGARWRVRLPQMSACPYKAW
jgi:DNA processing protein